ncbi:MAG TPA: tetratricopeptide repeat protein, partial [Bryobacteraceae bacterium]|nr:tetratricopeptide repeat protein [Bryobacteraceae bacterium]
AFTPPADILIPMLAEAAFWLFAALDTSIPDRLYAAGQFDQAAAMYRQMLRQSPKDVGLLARLGATDYQLGQFAEAESSFRKAVAVAPEMEQAQVGLGTTLLALDRAKEAVPFLEKAARLQPKDRMALRALGHAYQKNNDFFAGERTLRALVQADPTDEESQYYLGALLYDNNYYLPALDALNAALRLNPRNDQARIYRAGALAQLGRTDEAATEYRSLLDKPAAAAQPELWLGYAQFLFANDQLKPALAAIDHALSLLPDSAKLYFWRARIQADMREMQGAEADARKAIELAPDLPNAHNLLMKIDRANGDTAGADRQAAWLAAHTAGPAKASR